MKWPLGPVMVGPGRFRWPWQKPDQLKMKPMVFEEKPERTWCGCWSNARTGLHREFIVHDSGKPPVWRVVCIGQQKYRDIPLELVPERKPARGGIRKRRARR